MRGGPTSKDLRVSQAQLDQARRRLDQSLQEDVEIEGDRRLMFRSADGTQYMVRVDNDGFLYTAEADGTEHKLTIAAVDQLQAELDKRVTRKFKVADLPDPSDTEQLPVLVTNESGGKVLAFTDGTNWRRVTDRAIVS